MSTTDLTRLVSGQNMAWPAPWVRVDVQGLTCDISALLVGEDLQVRDSDDLVFYNQPAAGGVTWAAGPPQTVTVDLAALTSARALVVLSVDPTDPVLGGTQPQIVLSGPGGPLASFAPSGLTTERALICCEVYRRNGQWKVRAVGQGYDGGLAAAVRAHGIEVDDEPAPAPGPSGQPAGSAPSYPPPGSAAPTYPPPGPVGYAAPGTPASPPPVPPPPPGTSDTERMLSQVMAIFDDASRSTAGLESTLRYAENRMAGHVDGMLADPALRNSQAGQAAQEAARAEHDVMVRQATERHAADVTQLNAELAQWQQTAPASVADWDAPAWRSPAPVSGPPLALLLGSSHTDHAPHLRIPFLTGLPLHRPLWIRSEPGAEAAALRVARAYLVRMLAGYGPGGLRLETADLHGGSPTPFPPLGGPGCRIQTRPGAVSAAELDVLLRDLAHQADMWVMAHENRMLDSLPDPVQKLLLVTGFPYGFDENTLGLLEAITRHGAMSGVQVILVGEVQEQPAHRLLELLQERSRTVTSDDEGRFLDQPTDVVWRFQPDRGPTSEQLAYDALARASRGE